MHTLQPKHFKLKPNEAEEILKKWNISRSQLPKISVEDPAVPEGCQVGDIIKIERKFNDKTVLYFRVAV